MKTSFDLCPICGQKPICNGLGLVRREVPVGDPNFGKLFRCPNNAPEQDQGWHEKLRKIGNLEAYKDKTFDKFETNLMTYTESQKQSLNYAVNAAMQFTEHLDGWILLEGRYGCGKTHLAAAIANERVSRGDAVLFITVPDLLDHLRSAYGPTSEMGYDETFERVRGAPLLVLDDLGVENPSQWAREKLFQLLNHRYVSQLPTVITTNTGLESLDPRLASRIIDKNMVRRVVILAPDYRTENQLVADALQFDLRTYQHMTFDKFDHSSLLYPEERRDLHKAFEVAREYARYPTGWLLIGGNVSTGKTHLAAAIANEYQSTGGNANVITVPELLDYLRTAYNPDAAVTYDKVFGYIKSVPLLVLDDLHTKHSSPWAKEKLFQLLDYRYLTQMPTVITSYQNIEDFEPRIRSRLLDDRLCRRVQTGLKVMYPERMRRR